jgi:hypothetical protein
LQDPTNFSWKQTSLGFGQQTENSPNGDRWHLWVDGQLEPIGPQSTVSLLAMSETDDHKIALQKFCPV